MTSVPGTIAAEQAMLRQNVTMSVLKQAAENEKAVANILQETVESAPVSSSRGGNVNIQA